MWKLGGCSAAWVNGNRRVTILAVWGMNGDAHAAPRTRGNAVAPSPSVQHRSTEPMPERGRAVGCMWNAWRTARMSASKPRQLQIWGWQRHIRGGDCARLFLPGRPEGALGHRHAQAASGTPRTLPEHLKRDGHLKRFPNTSSASQCLKRFRNTSCASATHGKQRCWK